MATVRSIGPDDAGRAAVRAFCNRDVAPAFVNEGVFFGAVAEEAGEPVALGVVAWNAYGQAEGYFNRKGDVSPFVMHRTALRVIKVAFAVGVPAIYSGCDYRVPGARKWLERLGFRPEINDDGEEYFVCQA